MSIGQTGVPAPPVEVASGTALGLLVALAGASRAPREEVPDELAAALAAVGDVEGETWLNLLGISLDAGPPFTAERLLEARRVDGSRRASAPPPRPLRVVVVHPRRRRRHRVGGAR